MARQIVETTDGKRYRLLKRSADTSLVRCVDTAETKSVPTAELQPVTDDTVDSASLAAFDDAVVQVVTTVPDERGLKLLTALDTHGPVPVEALLTEYEFCERELHARIAELQAAGLVTREDIQTHRGYSTTERASEALTRLRLSPRRESRSLPRE